MRLLLEHLRQPHPSKYSPLGASCLCLGLGCFATLELNPLKLLRAALQMAGVGVHSFPWVSALVRHS